MVVTEEQLADAVTLGRETTGIDVDYTGAAGFAGVLALRSTSIGPDERVGIVFSGVRRDRA